MSRRLQDPDNREEVALCAVLSAVVIAQLQLHAGGSNAEGADARLFGHIDSETMAAESEKARVALQYQQKPSITILLSSFFLHIFYANCGNIFKSTLLLREAITFAQFLELDQARHYATLPKKEAQLHLRIFWLLFITERCVSCHGCSFRSSCGICLDG